MTNFYSRNEMAKFKKYRKHFTDQGYSMDIAENFAWDCIWASRKQKANHGFNFNIRMGS